MATLYDLAQAYLNRGLPDISGIFGDNTNNTLSPIDFGGEEPVSPQGLTSEQLALLYPQNQGGGGDDYRGGGAFNNLDLSKSKSFTKDIYDEEQGDFVPTEMTAYYNPSLGNYQTFDGKNINPAFSNTGMTFGIGGGIMNMLGMQPKTVGGYVPGSIRGYYDTPMDFFKNKKNEQESTMQQIAENIKADEIKMNNLRTAQITGGGGKDSGGGGEARSGGSSSGGTSSTNSSMGNLGFSDIRLKENVELIGKSPSNINIYKFNYKDNPTTYQGAMAHEVPWASIKHSNGYMMVDYDKLDVKFKKL